MLSIQVSDDLKALEKKKEETRKKVGGIDPFDEISAEFRLWLAFCLLQGNAGGSRSSLLIARQGTFIQAFDGDGDPHILSRGSKRFIDLPELPEDPLHLMIRPILLVLRHLQRSRGIETETGDLNSAPKPRRRVLRRHRVEFRIKPMTTSTQTELLVNSKRRMSPCSMLRTHS